MMRTLTTLLAILASPAALAWEAPESLVRTRQDLRSAVGDDDPALRTRLEVVWRQAEAEQEQALRHAVVRAAINGATQVLDHATDRLLEWAKTEKGRLVELLVDPETIGGPRGSADALRKAFFVASDDWNILVARVGKRLSGHAAQEYATATGLLLRRLRELADAGAPLKGRWLLPGFDRLSEQDSARELHRQAKALAVAHQQGDAGAADRVASLGWGQGGAPAGVATTLAELASYRQDLQAFSQSLTAAPVTAAAPAAAPLAARPAVTAAPAGDARAALLARLEALAEGLATAKPDGTGTGLSGPLRVGPGLTDPLASARAATGQPVRPTRGSLSLPPDVVSALDRQLAPEKKPADQTATRYGRLLAAWTPKVRAALAAAVAGGKLKEARRIYREVTGGDEVAAKARVGAMQARQDAGGKVDKAIGRAPTVDKLLQRIPAGREVVPADDVYLAETDDLPALAASEVSLPAVAAYLPPPAARDGEPNGDAQVEAMAQAALQGAWHRALATVHQLAQALEAARLQAEAEQRVVREAHLDAIRDAAFGPMPTSCPDQQEVCPCPEVHLPAAHTGRCHAVGTACAGQPPVDLSFR